MLKIIKEPHFHHFGKHHPPPSLRKGMAKLSLFFGCWSRLIIFPAESLCGVIKHLIDDRLSLGCGHIAFLIDGESHHTISPAIISCDDIGGFLDYGCHYLRWSTLGILLDGVADSEIAYY